MFCCYSLRKQHVHSLHQIISDRRLQLWYLTLLHYLQALYIPLWPVFSLQEFLQALYSLLTALVQRGRQNRELHLSQTMNSKRCQGKWFRVRNESESEESTRTIRQSAVRDRTATCPQTSDWTETRKRSRTRLRCQMSEYLFYLCCSERTVWKGEGLYWNLVHQ